MFNASNFSINAFCARALVTFLLVFGTGTALAGPIYRIEVDTSSWSGSGFLGLTLTGLTGAATVTATVSNFMGSFSNEIHTQGQVSGDVASAVRLAQGPSFNELLQGIDFGGLFAFDVRFDVPPDALDGSNFGLALVNADRTAYMAGTDGDIATIALMPGMPDAFAADARFVAITEVPEPGTAAIVMLGLLLIGGSRARRQPGAAERACSTGAVG